jgi:hypothetical protein
MKHLVIGMGEVGKALHKVLRDRYEIVDTLDAQPVKDDRLKKTYDVIHICFPYNCVTYPCSSFVEVVRFYKEYLLEPNGLCIIHSTVPLGTSDLCDAVHSPIRGRHPNLERGIRTFTKYFGGRRNNEACEIFSNCNISVVGVMDTRTTEALKLWDTAQYAWNVILEKEIHKWCEENKVDFDLVYTHANKTYNLGYTSYGQYLCKYVLDHMPGPIGGHCLIENAKLIDHWMTNLIVDMDEFSKRVPLTHDELIQKIKERENEYKMGQNNEK